MICSLSLFKNIKEGGKGTRMIPLSIYHHELKFIINLVNLIFFGGGGWKSSFLENKKGGRQENSRLLEGSWFSVFQLVISMWRQAESGRENKEIMLLQKTVRNEYKLFKVIIGFVNVIKKIPEMFLLATVTRSVHSGQKVFQIVWWQKSSSEIFHRAPGFETEFNRKKGIKGLY